MGTESEPVETSTHDAHISAASKPNGITEDEASLYDRQIRLWGLDAQNKMRSSTVAVLSLRAVAHEVIKNLVLAGIGRLIVMDDGVVTETDLGPGFLFREESSAVGTKRTTAALPQIASLNPLVSLTEFPTLDPFVTGDDVATDSSSRIVEFLQREKVDVLVACDFTRTQLLHFDAAARAAGTMFYAAGTYGFYGYTFADLGNEYEFVIDTPGNPEGDKTKMTCSYPSLAAVLDDSRWELGSSDAAAMGGSPFRGLTRSQTRDLRPAQILGILSVWQYESQHGSLPAGRDGQEDEIKSTFEQLRDALGVKPTAVRDPMETISHLASNSSYFFPPTLAILGGLLAQDVLRALSRKDQPIANFLSLDSLDGTAAVTRWAMKAPSVSSP